MAPSRSAPASVNATPVPTTSSEANITFCAASVAPSATRAEASTAAEEEVAVMIA